MKHSLRRKLTSTILAVVLLSIAIVSFTSNYFINRLFADYVKEQQLLQSQIIVSTMSSQYDSDTDHWNLDNISALGMFSIYDGYIIKVMDANGTVLWDAQSHDMELCNRVMADIEQRMNLQYPGLNGEFKTTIHEMAVDDTVIGSVSISNFGPYFLDDSQFEFLRSLNAILLGIGVLALLVSIVIGSMLAKRISEPILKTVEAAGHIAAGNYTIRLEESSGTGELKMLVTSINDLANSLESMEAMRKQLTEDVAHELRTPVTILQSYIESMMDGMWDVTPERLNSCYEEVDRIGRLIDDLEKLSRIESEGFHLSKKSVALHTVLESTVSGFFNELDRKGLTIEITGSQPIVSADPDRLQQVATNLLSNAVKYAKEGSPLSVHIFESDDEAGFSFNDKGDGIPKEELPFIFERFYRADKSRNRSTGGSGIGLTIVKSIVEAHGGRVEVESVVGIGSTFTVTIPKV